MKKLINLSAGVCLAVLVTAAPASAATVFNWAPQSVDTGSSSDFDVATQTIAPITASELSFSGFGYYHTHGGVDGFKITATVNGVLKTIYTSPSTSQLTLQDIGTISFAGGTITSIGLASNNYVGNAFHAFSGETFTLGGSVANVPEPASWALMIAGFGLVGAASRRRGRAAVVFA